MAVDVVAGRDQVDAGGEDLVRGALGDPDPARRVLAVGDDEVGLELLAQRRQQLREAAPAGAADDVADEEDPHGAQPRSNPLRGDRRARPAKVISFRDRDRVPLSRPEPTPRRPRSRRVGLTKRFGDRLALGDVDFTAAAGEVLAVIGPNGAGKTTLLSILAGIREADAGEIRLPRGEVGFVPQQAALYRRLTVAENLRLFARLEEVDDVEAAVGQMLEQTGLGDRRDDQVGHALGRQPAADQHRDRPALRSCRAAARRALDRPRPAPARRASGSSSSASPAAARP